MGAAGNPPRKKASALRWPKPRSGARTLTCADSFAGAAPAVPLTGHHPK